MELRTDAIHLEETRLEGVGAVEEYGAVHERHRMFPDLFEFRCHRKILDISAGVGVVAQRIKENYSTSSELTCNEISPTALKILKNMGVKTTSFDLDNDSKPYPVKTGTFDAVISLATIEHLMNFDHFLDEIYRILDKDGYLYISAPNYSGIPYLLPFLRTGKTFHDPMNPVEKYEFYAHVRYFTYRTLTDVVQQHGFVLDTAYVGLPKEGSRFLKLKEKSPFKAFVFRTTMSLIYRLFSPRWASEPVLCFRKGDPAAPGNVRKMVL